jgi:RNA polymerase sigma-70 factor (ECF subfamily)
MLIAAFQESGDKASLEVLVRQHIGRVRSMIFSMVLNEADADDLTQEVFLRVAQALGGFRKKARFSTWLFRIAMNTTNDFLRKKQRSPIASETELPALVAGDPVPSDQLAIREADAQISTALAALSPRLRAAITLTAIHDLETAEAARIENCTVAVMYWRVHQARQLLKAKLKGQLS